MQESLDLLSLFRVVPTLDTITSGPFLEASRRYVLVHFTMPCVFFVHNQVGGQAPDNAELLWLWDTYLAPYGNCTTFTFAQKAGPSIVTNGTCCFRLFGSLEE
jgi:hypothetical protein